MPELVQIVQFIFQDVPHWIGGFLMLLIICIAASNIHRRS
jgi:hypothetical protein